MLRNVLIMASSGLVLFSKEFLNAISQPRLTGSLMTAIIEFSSKTTGIPVSYIELSSVAVSLICNENSKVICALFHDKLDGPKFGRMVANEILGVFVREYGKDLGTMGHNLRDFHGFHAKLEEIIPNVVHPILSTLQQHRGVLQATLVTKDEIYHSTADVDQLGILANLQALISISDDLMALVGDNTNLILLEASNSSRVHIVRIHGSILLVVYKKKANPIKCSLAIQDAIFMLTKLCSLMTSMHQLSKFQN